MAGLVGVVVAGGLLRRRALSPASRGTLREAPGPLDAPFGAPAWSTLSPARPLDDVAWRPCADDLARALGVAGEPAEGTPEPWPLPRRGPSGRERSWGEPSSSAGE
ncbi:hypothetical protein OV207_10815 [Corallococcus sp. BB11-1]|uniref:hypothetical protein n=1 Tax=Corallococcus sp. BB11-1 TaxID=2996783 RepID=UPI00226D422E|nr:hypothetical protein [Corallococcus sp. BB11-1]MCY1031948.1 hypothetical protein [Corallococcus sp. BB11-1]